MTPTIAAQCRPDALLRIAQCLGALGRRTEAISTLSRGFRTRNLNIAFASISAVGYSVQLGLGAALLANTRNAALQHALVLVIVALYCSALGRTWKVTGITGGDEEAR
jgi:hypothetical protein